MWYRITPNDTLFFRDGKPFTMGAETWADVIFPPNPSTLYGAIRTWLIFEKGDLRSFRRGSFESELGTPDTKGSLKIKGPILVKNGELLFPSPLDLLKREGNGGDNILNYLTFSNTPDIFISDYRLCKVLIWKGMEHMKVAEGYITGIYLNDYLSGRENLRLTEAGEIYTLEPKIGIARNRITKAVLEGHFYHIPMVRLRDDVGIAVWIEGVASVPESGIIQLGGEGRTARVERMDKGIFREIEDISLSLDNRLFKVYFATPAFFENGYLPSWVNGDTFEGEYGGIRLRLVNCVIGKYKLIGGWDIARNKPKQMFRAIPAGSVYYFEILDDSDFGRVKDIFHFRNISDRYSEEGYGLSLIGVVRL